MDVVQETWLRVIRHAGSFREESSLRTWLYRIVVNQSRTFATRATRLVKHKSSVPIPVGDISHDKASLPSIAQAVESLDESKREVLLLCHHRGMTHEQVASILEIPLGTVKSRLHAAVTAVRERLASEMLS
jgi:RNA polymerase sigma-70 factor, ECF subfamily